MITLKHIAREFDLDPYRLRQHLRQNLKHRRYQRWQWPDNDPQLTQVRTLAKQLAGEPNDQ